MHINLRNILIISITVLFIFHTLVTLAIIRKMYLHVQCKIFTMILDMVISVAVANTMEMVTN